MPTSVYQNNSFSSGIISQDFSMQSILDVFVVQGLISHDDAEKLKGMYRSNAEIEKVLINNRIVTRETINKAYSILLKVPYVSLINTAVNKDVLNIIPKKVCQRYGIIPFGLKGNILQVAISQPSQLDQSFNENIDKVMSGQPYRIDLYITGPEDFGEVLKQYSGSVSAEKLASSSLPVVYLRNQNLSEVLLRQLPLDFIEKHRAVIFYKKDDSYSLAAEVPDSADIRKAMEYLQRENNISIQVFATSKEDIDYAIESYKDLDKNEELVDQKKQSEQQETDGKRSEEQIENELNSAKMQATSNLQPKNAIQKEATGKDSGSFSFSNFFGGIKLKDDSGPLLTVDSYEKSGDLGNDLKEEADKTQSPIITEGNKEEKSEELSEINLNEQSQEGSPPAITIEENNQQPVAAAPTKELRDGDGDEEIGSLLDKDIESEDDLKQALSDNYIPKAVAAIINYALKLRSSDIHIEASAKDLRVRYRVDGVLRDIAKLPLSMHPPVISRIKILAKMKIDETRIPQDGRFEVKFKSREVDVRVSALPTVHGEKIVMRVLDKDQGILSLEDLGMNGRAFDITVENIAKPYGIILSTGPTGSGKSTTLYAILNRISTPSVNIVTLEDPVEYEINGVNQCQIKPSIGFTFAEGLRSVLRQDPNIVMVGEIRDSETASMATHAALTGHLVLSTLHTNDSAGALPRLINMGIEPFLITSSVNEIIAQRLIRRICPKCKEEMKMPQALIDEIKKELDAIPENNKRDKARVKPELKFYHGVGCSECNQGYKGRVGIFEVLRMTDKIEELAITKQSANDIKNAAIEDGMITMRQDGILKCLEGLTTIDEVFRATSD